MKKELSLITVAAILIFSGSVNAWWNNSQPYRYHLDNNASLLTQYGYSLNDTNGICGGNFTYGLIANLSYAHFLTTDLCGAMTPANETDKRPFFNPLDCTGYNIKDVYNAEAVYCFGEKSGNVALDCSGNDNHGAMTDCSRGSHIIGEGIYFNGASATIKINDSVTTSLVDDLTLMGWFNISDQHSHLMDKGSTSGWAGEFSFYYISGTGLYYKRGNGVNDETAQLCSFTPDDSEKFFAVVYKGWNWTLYIDGDVECSHIVGSTSIVDTALDIYIGSRGGVDRWTKGWTDEDRIFNRSMEIEEIREYHQNQIGNRTKFGVLETTGDYTNIAECASLSKANWEYRLTADILNSSNSTCFNIEAENITLDCQGHLIEGNGSADNTGISSDYFNTTIKNCVIDDWNRAIHLWGNADNSTIDGLVSSGNYIVLDVSGEHTTVNNLTSNYSDGYGIYAWGGTNYLSVYNSSINSTYYGITLTASEHATLKDIKFPRNGRFSIYPRPAEAADCLHNINNCTGQSDKAILWHNTTATTIENCGDNISEIVLCDAGGSIINNINITQPFRGDSIVISHTDGVNITNVKVNNTHRGIQTDYYSKNIRIINFTSLNGTEGIVIGRTNDTYMENIDIIADLACIYISYNSHNIEMYNVSVANPCWYGVELIDTDNITIDNLNADVYYASLKAWSGVKNLTLKNSILQGSRRAVYFRDMNYTGNQFYNNFLNATYYNVNFSGTIYNNTWNTTQQSGTRIHGNGTQIGGNYWTNPTGTGYSDTCTDSDTDGFCDSPLNLTNMVSCIGGSTCGNNTDYLPLSNKYSAAPTAAEDAVETILRMYLRRRQT